MVYSEPEGFQKHVDVSFQGCRWGEAWQAVAGRPFDACCACFHAQEERVNSYLHVSTRPKLLKEVGLRCCSGTVNFRLHQCIRASFRATLIRTPRLAGQPLCSVACSTLTGQTPACTLLTAFCLPFCDSPGGERAAAGAPDAAAREGAQRMRGAAAGRQGTCCCAVAMAGVPWGVRACTGLRRGMACTHGMCACRPAQLLVPCLLLFLLLFICCRRATWRACTACSTGCLRGWSPWPTSSASTWRRRVRLAGGSSISRG